MARIACPHCIPALLRSCPLCLQPCSLADLLWCTTSSSPLQDVLWLIPHGQGNLLQSFRLKSPLGFRGDNPWFGCCSVPFSAFFSCIRFTADIKYNIQTFVILSVAAQIPWAWAKCNFHVAVSSIKLKFSVPHSWAALHSQGCSLGLLRARLKGWSCYTEVYKSFPIDFNRNRPEP